MRPASAPSRAWHAAYARGGPRAIGAGIYVLLHLAWLIGHWGDGGDVHRRTVIADLFLAPVFLFIALAARHVSRHRALPTRARRSWRWVALSYVLLWLANLLWLGYDALQPSAALLDGGRVLVLASYVPLLVGLLSFPTARRAFGQRLALSLDLATVVLGVGLVMWELVERPSIARPVHEPLAFLLKHAVPAFDFMVVVAIAALLARRVNHGSRLPLALLAAGQLLSIAAGVVAAVLVRNGMAPAPGSTVDALWMLSGALVYLAPIVQERVLSGAVEPPPSPRDDGRDPLRLLPALGVALAAGLLLASTRVLWGTSAGVVLFGSVTIMGLVLARQIVALQAHRRAEAALAESEERYRTLVEHLDEVVFRTDAEGRWTFLNPAWTRLTGRTAEASLERRATDFVHPEDRAALHAALHPLVLGWTDECRHELRQATAGGVRWVQCHVRAVRDADGALLGTTGTIVDVTTRRAAEEQLRHQAFHDPLTGLTNRALFRDRLERALARVRSLEGRAVVFFLDLDGFKAINDRFGHAAGDQVLIEVGARLLAATRGSDAVARFGGDEFAILLERTATDDDVRVVAERVLAAVATPMSLAGEPVTIETSIGIAHAEPPDDVDTLLARADEAMYRAKRAGKGRYVGLSESVVA